MILTCRKISDMRISQINIICSCTQQNTLQTINIRDCYNKSIRIKFYIVEDLHRNYNTSSMSVNYCSSPLYKLHEGN